MLSTPTPANESSWSAVADASPAAAAARWARARSTCRPRAMRQTPRRSSATVATMSTEELGSSVHSTGVSLMRSPSRSAVTRSSVSKNHASSLTRGSSWQRALAPDGLEAALEVRDAAVQGQADDMAVGARDQLTPGSAHDPRPPGESGAHREVAVAREHRAHQREQGRERGRQVDVHVGQHVGLAGRPGRAQCVPAAFARQHHGRDPVEVGGQPLGDQGRPVGAAVVGDGDEGAEGEGLVEVAAQRGDARLETGRLVVHGDDDLDLEGGIVACGAGPRPVGATGAMAGRVRPPRMGGHSPSRCFHPTPPRHERRRG